MSYNPIQQLLCVDFHHVICAGFSLCHAQSLVCVMCSLQSVLSAVFSLCYVQRQTALGLWGSRIGPCRGVNRASRGMFPWDGAFAEGRLGPGPLGSSSLEAH